MRVNKTIYPDDTAASTDIYTVTSLSLRDIEDQMLEVPTGSDYWEQSVGFAMSTADFAPFNTIDYIFADMGATAPEIATVTKTQQNIVLYLTPNVNGSTYNQYYNGSSGGRFIGLLSGSGAQQSWRRTPDWTETWHTINQHYNYNFYKIVTGVDLTKILGCIYIGFHTNTGFPSYCSYKQYMADRQNYPHPSFAFMVCYKERTPSEAGTIPTLTALDMNVVDRVEWAFLGNQWTWQRGEISSLFPPAAAITIEARSENPAGALSGQIANPVVIPLAGFMPGYQWTQYNYATQFPGTSHGTAVYGGGDSVVYMVDGSNHVYTQLTESCIQNLMSVAATFGIPFTDDYIYDITDLHSGNDSYMPIQETNGCYNGRYEALYLDGEYVLEDAAAENIYSGGKDAPYNDRNPDPDDPPAEIDIDLVQPSITPIGAFNTTYIIDKDTVDLMQDIIYGSDDTFMDNFLNGLRNYGQNPMNAFISLHMYPFDVAVHTGATVSQPIAVGKTTLRTADVIAQGLIMPPNAKAVIDCGKYKIPETFGCYLDYEPYTTIQLYIPYIGTIELQPSLYVGKTVSVKLIIDWITGAAAAVVYADGIPLIYQQGVIGMSISMTGDDSARRSMSAVGSIVGAVGSAAKSVANFMGGNVAGGAKDATEAIGGLVGAATAYLPTEFQQAGTSSPICGLYMPDICYITISRPIPGDSFASWGKLNGFAMSQPGQLGYTALALDPAGLIQCVPWDTSMQGYAAGLTDAEASELREIMSSGFRLENLT